MRLPRKDTIGQPPKGLGRLPARGIDAKKLREGILVRGWREIGESDQPSFQNSWVNYGSTWATAAFRKDELGNVWIKGLVKSGTIGQVVFTLPTGYRPKLSLTFSTISNDALGRLQVTATGNVEAVTGSSVWFSLQCSFSAEQ